MSDLEQYKAALAHHDWSYDYSDDYSAWCRGKAQRDAICRMQRELDPDYSIWNSIAPEGYRIKQVA